MSTALAARRDRAGDPIRYTERSRHAIETMAEAIRVSLSRRPLRELPSEYFYDDRGSALFEQITELPEYYQTRTETALLQAHAAAIVGELRPHELVELGSGAGIKIRTFLDAMRERGLLQRVLLLEIAEPYLRRSVTQLWHDYPEARVQGIAGDFVHDLAEIGPGGSRLLLLLAGTIGNLHPDRLQAFFRSAARTLELGDAFLVGVDLVKDPLRLEAAYDDSRGVTAAFNRNILHVVNDNLDGDIDPLAFEHVAFWNPEQQWIEMRLRALRPVRASIRRAGVELDLAAGEEIRTEISCKYTRESFSVRLRGTGLFLQRWICDPS